MTENNIKTLPSGLQYSRDFSEYDGCVVMHNAKTINRYRELQEEKSKHDCYRYDCFFAFSNQQFAEGLKKIRPLKEGEKLVSVGAGMYGTRDGVDKFFAAYVKSTSVSNRNATRRRFTSMSTTITRV